MCSIFNHVSVAGGISRDVFGYYFNGAKQECCLFPQQNEFKAITVEFVLCVSLSFHCLHVVCCCLCVSLFLSAFFSIEFMCVFCLVCRFERERVCVYVTFVL